MKYLIFWVQKLPPGSSVWAYIKLILRLIRVDLFKMIDRIVVAAGWGFGLTMGFYLFQGLLAWLYPAVG